jgi:outer membrane protein assembly factor BamA
MGVALKVAIVFAAFSDVAYSDPSLAPRVGRIIVEGNRVTDQRVILNQIKLYPGQTLRPSQLWRAKWELVRLNLFDAVDVTMLQSDSRYKDIRVRVKESMPGQVFIASVVHPNPNSNTGK